MHNIRQLPAGGGGGRLENWEREEMVRENPTQTLLSADHQWEEKDKLLVGRKVQAGCPLEVTAGESARPSSNTHLHGLGKKEQAGREAIACTALKAGPPFV